MSKLNLGKVIGAATQKVKEPRLRVNSADQEALAPFSMRLLIACTVLVTRNDKCQNIKLKHKSPATKSK